MKDLWSWPSFETHARDCARAPQRLCCVSSELPSFFVSEHGVEDGEELASNRDDGDHFWLTGGEQTLIEDLEHWVVTTGHEGSEEDGAAGVGTTAGNHAFA